MLKIIRFLFGAVHFCARGPFPERFINLASRSGVVLWNVRCRGEKLRACTMASEYRTLRGVSRKTSMEMRLQSKRGLPFLWRGYRRRKGLFVGVAAFCAIIYFLSLYVWSVEVSGAKNIDESELCEVLQSQGVGVGTARKRINPSEIEHAIMCQFDNISWMAANLEGCNLKIEIKESVQVPQLIDVNIPCNVKASAEGLVTKIEIYRGTPEVGVGDAVSAGQLLVNSIVENAQGGVTMSHADAKVFVQRTRQMPVEVDFSQCVEVPAGKKIVRRRVKIFGVEIPLGVTRSLGEGYRKETSVKTAKLFGAVLPLTAFREEWTRYAKKQVEISPEEALQKAREILNEREKNELSGVKILNKGATEHILATKIYIDAAYICEENVAFQEEIFCE